MAVAIQRITGEQICQVSLGSPTVEAVLLELEKLLGIPVKHQRLLLGGQVLASTRSLVEQGISSEDALVHITLTPEPHDLNLDELGTDRGMGAACLKFMLQAKADANRLLASGQAPLVAAARRGLDDCVAALLDARANPQRSVALPVAVKQKHAVCVRLLLDAQAGPDVMIDLSLMLAIDGGDIPSLELLLRARADPAAEDSHGDFPLLRAAGFGNATCVSLLLDARADAQQASGFDGSFALLSALLHHDGACIGPLLEARANPQQADRSGNFPLLQAVQKWSSIPSIQLLLRAHADPNQIKPGDGTSPLELAALLGHENCVRLLLEERANPDHANARSGKTPLQRAEERCYEGCIRILLEGRAEPQEKADSEETD